MVHPIDVCRHDIDIRRKPKLDAKGNTVIDKTPINHRNVDPRELLFENVIHLPRFLKYVNNMLHARIESIGKLSFKTEKSGKVRVFASIDYWTQSFLRPLHRWLFSILKKIPQDATFDQGGAVKRFSEQIDSKTKVYSYDLSAATDRLPLVLQVELLSRLLKDAESAVLWGLLLVGRQYFIHRRKKIGDPIPRVKNHMSEPTLFDYPLTNEHAKDMVQFLRDARETNTCSSRVMYAVGQPMGALTSWAMLALTHHAIVQMAARRAGYSDGVWFPDYLILGDDIVIANTKVATQYRRLMMALDVSLSSTKGVESDNGSFEFAKEFYYRGKQASPFSWAEMKLSVSSLPGLVVLFQKERRIPKWKIGQVVRAFGFGYQVTSKLNSGYLRLIRQHPRVVPLLLLSTFPDTTKISAKCFSDWVRAFSLNLMVPVSTLKGLPLSFMRDTVYPKALEVRNVTWHVRSLNDYLSKVALQLKKVHEYIESSINQRMLRDRERNLFPYCSPTDPITKHPGEYNTQLDVMFENYCKISECQENEVAWFPPVVHREDPLTVNKLGKWVKMKIKMLETLRQNGKLEWRS
jgi:hypothetical protein